MLQDPRSLAASRDEGSGDLRPPRLRRRRGPLRGAALRRADLYAPGVEWPADVALELDAAEGHLREAARVCACCRAGDCARCLGSVTEAGAARPGRAAPPVRVVKCACDEEPGRHDPVTPFGEGAIAVRPSARADLFAACVRLASRGGSLHAVASRYFGPAFDAACALDVLERRGAS